MKRHKVIRTTKGIRLLNPQGEIIKTSDADRRMLHIFPALYLTTPMLRYALEPKNIRLSVSTDQTGWSPEPVAGPIQISQCIPNRGYMVGGDMNTRYGWLVQVPEAAGNHLRFCLEWQIGLESLMKQQTIRHELDVTLQPGRFHCWSMDSCAWHRVYTFAPHKKPLDIAPRTPFPTRAFSPHRNIHLEKTGAHGFTYQESMDLPAIPYSDLAYLDDFEEKQLHELERASHITHKVDHPENAITEIPLALFVQAVRLTQDIPIKKDIPAIGHPAIRLLTDWWNSCFSDQTEKAVSLMIWVRVDQTDYYRCGYREFPNRHIDEFAETKTAQARVGDEILIQFMRGIRTADIGDDGWVKITLVNEARQDVIDTHSTDDNESWYGWTALCQFPEQYPELWASMTTDHASR